MNDQPAAEDPEDFESEEDSAESDAIRKAAHAAIRLMTTDQYMELLDKADGFEEFFLLASQFKPSDDPQRLALLEIQRAESAHRNQLLHERIERLVQRVRDQGAPGAEQGPGIDET